MIRGILLAAGSGTRFGGAKLEHPLSDGTTIGTQSARNLIAGTGNALAVLRPGDNELAAALREVRCEIFFAPSAKEGMGASLAAAIAATADAAGWVVALADMPFIEPSIIAAVKRALEGGARIAAPVFRASGARGHPVGFSASLGAVLLNLRGDSGARSVIDEYRDELVALPTHDRGILVDIDRRDDLGRGD